MGKCYWNVAMDNVNNVIQLFPKLMKEGLTSNTPANSVSRFDLENSWNKQGEIILDQFNNLSVFQKYEAIKDIIEISNNLYKVNLMLKERLNVKEKLNE